MNSIVFTYILGFKIKKVDLQLSITELILFLRVAVYKNQNCLLVLLA